MMTSCELHDYSQIFFGGSFDPPHEGHFDCIKQVRASFPQSPITVLVSPNPPAIAGVQKHQWLELRHRTELAKKAFCGQGVSDISVSDWESTLLPPYYTYRTLQELQKRNPNQHFGFMMGFDQWQSFAYWANPHLILEIADLIIICRKSEKTQFEVCLNLLMDQIQAELIGRTPKYHLLRLKTNHAARIYYLDSPTIEVSSSLIRERLKNRLKIPSQWLNPAVAAALDTMQNKD